MNIIIKKNNGFTLFESMIAFAVSSLAVAGLTSYTIKETKSTLVKSFVDQSYDIVKAVDHRIAIDGYDPDLWTKKEWLNEKEVVEDLIGKNLVSKHLKNCSGGEWEPVPNSEYETKLIGCNHWKGRKNNGEEISAELIVDGIGFIQSFNLYIRYNNIDDFKNQFLNIRKAILRAETSISQELIGSHYIDFISWNSKMDISSSECVKDILDCTIKYSVDRNGGNEYLRADGGNSMIGEKLTFVETKGQAPMKCVRWKNTARDGTGSWEIEPFEDCGVGVYRNDPHPVMVDLVADTGTFKNILLDKECKVYAWDSTTKKVIDTGDKSPCGTMNTSSNEIVQIVDNIQSESVETHRLYTDEAHISNVYINDIVADTIESKYAYIENELKTDIIKSFTNNNDIVVYSKMNLKEMLKVENDVDIIGNVNALSGTINDLTAPNLTNNNMISKNMASFKDINASGSTVLNGSFKTTNHAEFKGDVNFKKTPLFESGGTFNGRVTNNEYLQLNGVANENWGCSPNGLISRTSSGKILSCTNGIWKASSYSPSVRQVHGRSSAYRWPSKVVNCSSSEVVVGGGVQCHAVKGYLRMPANRPNGNGWYGSCDTDRNQTVIIDVYAICMRL